MPNAYADLTTIKSNSYLNITGTGDDTYLRLLLETASRAIDIWCNRHFYVWTGTKYYDGGAYSLLTDDILAITTFKLDQDCDGTYEITLSANRDYELYPLNEFVSMWAEISSRADRVYSDFNPGVKKGVQIIGSFGYGTGATATPYKDSGAVVNTGNMAIDATTHALATGKGASFAIGQTILINSEQLYITGISTDTLTFAFNPLRGQNGTTAAAHTSGATIYIYEYPDAIKLMCLIQTMRWWKRKDSAFANVIGNVELGTTEYYRSLDPDVRMIVGMYKRFRF